MQYGKKKEIKGIRITKQEVRQGLFADDMSLCENVLKNNSSKKENTNRKTLIGKLGKIIKKL